MQMSTISKSQKNIVMSCTIFVAFIGLLVQACLPKNSTSSLRNNDGVPTQFDLFITATSELFIQPINKQQRVVDVTKIELQQIQDPEEKKGIVSKTSGAQNLLLLKDDGIVLSSLEIKVTDVDASNVTCSGTNLKVGSKVTLSCTGGTKKPATTPNAADGSLKLTEAQINDFKTTCSGTPSVVKPYKPQLGKFSQVGQLNQCVCSNGRTVNAAIDTHSAKAKFSQVEPAEALALICDAKNDRSSQAKYVDACLAWGGFYRQHPSDGSSVCLNRSGSVSTIPANSNNIVQNGFEKEMSTFVQKTFEKDIVAICGSRPNLFEYNLVTRGCRCITGGEAFNPLMKHSSLSDLHKNACELPL
jgi:hypothetical protein